MSFHDNYEKWLRKTDPENCPVCNAAPMPEGMIDLYERKHSWLNAEPVDCLKYTCHVTSKHHGPELFDLTEEELNGLMKDVQIYAQALKQVSHAVKINYEIHGNTQPHLHVHLYPRFVNDPFPGKAIDYNQKRNLYEPGEYEAFVAAMRQALDDIRKNEQ
jgi:diadenosine tetraphosphate (Ap4A) HIT family hydrolase